MRGRHERHGSEAVVEVYVELTYFATEFLSGNLMGLTLPLHEVHMSGKIDGEGTFSALLDTRRLVPDGGTDWARLREIITATQPGMVSIAAVRENMTSGSSGGYVDRVEGEFLVTHRRRRNGSPILELQGVDLRAYFNRRRLEKTWSGSVDVLLAARQILLHACTDGQTLQLAIAGDSTCGSVQSVRYIAGQAMAGQALKELQGDQLWEWTIKQTLNRAAGRIDRTAYFSSGSHQVQRPDVVLDARTPGTPPGSVYDVVSDDDLDWYAIDIRGWGAGSGPSQIRADYSQPRPAGFPVLSQIYTSNAISKGALQREVNRIARQHHVSRRPYTMLARVNSLPGGDKLGWVCTWLKEPAYGWPTGESGTVRIIAWDWSQPRPGEEELITLTTERLT